MRTSAAGNKPFLAPGASPGARGFTLLELLVVISIIAIAIAGVALSLRDRAQSRTEQEAVRLAALLDSARAQSRTRGVPVVWYGNASGFRFAGLPRAALPENWLDADSVVIGSNRLELGPDPIIAAQTLVLGSRRQASIRFTISTDGLRPFSVNTLGPVEAAVTIGATP